MKPSMLSFNTKFETSDRFRKPAHTKKRYHLNSGLILTTILKTSNFGRERRLRLQTSDKFEKT